ncbi:CYFA0S08e03378g1_1 [Cyberlindnera fabianii]|uniref:CYFA0S08e03378g1_1 n=1 Tax=Cyberlindnera fabianii TaxID=36022 RepID=A0A061AWR4_CYBFA|nr:putative diacetyl reductase [(R)-acetoin forming] 2 [Cyberlindnera fabianii]CDR42081.1 CYFA0S08e03378g1_1 [Cyberlindnera fabianii]
MKGIVYYGPKDVRYESNLEAPSIQHPDEVLVDVSYCGICGSDLKEFSADPPNFFQKDNAENPLTGKKPPLCMGHEIAGTVVEVGDNVKDVKVGDQVVIDPSVHCVDKTRFPGTHFDVKEKCTQCARGLTNICEHSSLAGLGAQDGGLAEKFVCASRHAVVVPKSIPLEIACLAQPLAVSYHAVRISHFKAGSSALVLGGGAIGLAAILCLQGFKASNIVVSEPSKVRRDNAEKLGAKVFDPSAVDGDVLEEIMKLSPNGDGFDYTFDCSGLQVTLDTAIHAAASNGTIVNVAIWGKKPVNFWPMDITRSEKKLMGSMCYTREDFEGVLDCFEKGDIDEERARGFITTVVSLENGMEGGFKHLMENKDTEIKVLITPNNHGELEYSKNYTKVPECD